MNFTQYVSPLIEKRLMGKSISSLHPGPITGFISSGANENHSLATEECKRNYTTMKKEQAPSMSTDLVVFLSWKRSFQESQAQI